LAAREQTFKLLDLQHRRMGSAKVGILLLTAVVAWLALGKGLFSPLWIAAPALCFAALAVIHERMIKGRLGALRAVTLYRDGIDRLAGRWAGRGCSGSRFRSSKHPYTEDLDIFGPGSLFELLCAARTRTGEERLAAWLGHPSEVPEICSRQGAVIELKHKLDLREDVALAGEEAAEAADLAALRKWASEELSTTPPAIVLAARAITLFSIVAALYAAMGFARLPLELSILVGQSIAFFMRKSHARAAFGLERSARDLQMLSALLARLEIETFQTPILAKLIDRVSGGGELPSKRISRLLGIVTWRDAMRSSLFAIIGIALLWNTHSAIALERWRRENGSLVAAWIDAVSTFEAISSLSRYAYEQQGVTMPDLVESDSVLEAVCLKHPLLTRADATPNTLSINTLARLYIVSGSNMSGKSTLLRTVGINTVLALAGAPVCAERMRIGPLHIGASLRAGDSLQAGVSRFYAEIKRLRQIVDIARESAPALFLLDEILHGTNSHDRTVGAEAVIRALLSAGAVGLVTTHDLALARIADDKSLHAVNVHFQDEMLEGRMVFDYCLRPGVVQKSNAIPLMRAVGLDV